jgi:hypothetical protein
MRKHGEVNVSHVVTFSRIFTGYKKSVDLLPMHVRWNPKKRLLFSIFFQLEHL